MGMLMGAWDIGPFDNDTAADFANDLDDAAEHERIPLLRRALDAVIACDAYLDSDFGVEALAASAIAARELPGGQEFASDAYVERILGEDSEIRQLWLEGDETGDGPWLASTRRLRDILAAA
ncbi:DUF4259 domain-containing protein [Actinospica sp. MGRD01-02]|uniref:DUF4259 domain-containing protein n=1 Tax=Actinospica acidithermotolerans TaxID=2828514 RepID=A0A941EDA5_9ACTN|nr:DUF4259 domain-containing protein [Actinospica acidithermotolerans]MBR7828295.1 DUF4259 domain-containing protein [Actinospica acidithermotolerans]